MCKLSETSNDDALCSVLNHENNLMQLLHCLSLSSSQLESAVPLAAQFPLCSLNRTTWSGIICDFLTSFREFLDLVVNRFTGQTLPTVNRKHFFRNNLCIESFCPQKAHKRALLFGSLDRKHDRHFGYWNLPLNMHMRVCYLICHEAGLCCLVIHIENLYCPLQLFYFHLCSIY
jgi:hypothetical protein